MFAADHGEEFGDHGGRGHRFTLYSELTHVPLFVHQPGVGPRRVRVDVSSVDLLPTLRSILGLPASEQDAGIDLTKLYAAGDGRSEERTLYASRTTGMAWKRAVVRGRYKLIVTRPGKNELYDLESDPGERRNLAEERPALAEELLRSSDDFRSTAHRWDGSRTTIKLDEKDLRRLKDLGYVDVDS